MGCLPFPFKWEEIVVVDGLKSLIVLHRKYEVVGLYTRLCKAFSWVQYSYLATDGSSFVFDLLKKCSI